MAVEYDWETLVRRAEGPPKPFEAYNFNGRKFYEDPKPSEPPEVQHRANNPDVIEQSPYPKPRP